jgi:hydrogenase-4 component E
VVAVSLKKKKVFGVFVFRIRERFDTVDVEALDRFRGERRDHT